MQIDLAKNSGCAIFRAELVCVCGIFVCVCGVCVCVCVCVDRAEAGG